MSIEKIEAELREGLDAASKGTWQEGARWVFIDPIDPERNPTHALRNLLRDVPDDELQANVKHIVAAQPENIRALLDELSRLREERDRIKTALTLTPMAERLAELPDFMVALSEWGCTDPSEQAASITDFLNSLVGLKQYLEETHP